jgi:glucose-6-phosphate 1-epimerase
MMTALPDGVRVDEGDGGLARLSVATDLCKGEAYLHGAHVCGWQPRDQAHPVLWMSARSMFAAGRPIRGGVPICFPWFGPHPNRTDAPAHGFARIQPWTLDRVSTESDGTVVARFTLVSNEASRAFEADVEFEALYTVRFGAALGLELTVTNTGRAAFGFEEALHTYLAVGDARRVALGGLAGAEYYDKTDGRKRKREGDEPVRFAAETDRLYVGTAATVTLDDPDFGRRLRIAKSGSGSTVVWNPWVAKSAAMPDFGDDEWTGMACVETANAADNAVHLDAGARHAMTAAVSVEPLHLGSAR